MMFYRKFSVLIFAVLLVAACSNNPKFLTPLETLQNYSEAVRKKDTTTMKLLLSNATIKMHHQSAQEQGITLDEIVERETMFSQGQKIYEFRNEIVEGDTATLEIKNAYGIWDKVNFVREEGVWKIDKQAFVNPILQDNELKNQQLDEMINQGKQP